MTINIEPKIIEEIHKILLQFGEKYVQNGILKKYKITEDLKNYDEDLLKVLLSNEVVEKHYISKIDGASILKINQLIEMLQYKEFWKDSYTKYSNKIGLTQGGKYLSDSEDVVLDFPYKDNLLKAGMTKEDVDTEELFFNDILAKAEIDTLLEKKIFRNVKKYSANGVEKEFELSDNDNLIIKGNNLLSLYSLFEKYEGKIKAIYIDPPYNTGSDSFKYNDRFNHSTWLTFMKNRLEVAHKLLSEDGVIFVQTDDSEQAYLKVLLDEIFDRRNYINTVSVLFKNTAGVSGGGEDKRLKKNIEFITIYTKNYDMHKGFESIYEYTPISDLVQKYKEEGVSWKYTTALIDSGEKKYFGTTFDGSGNEIRIYQRINAQIKSISQIIKEEGISEEEAYFKYSKVLFQTTNAQTSIRQRVMDYTLANNNTEDLISIEYIPKSGKNKGKVYEQFYKGDKCRLFAWLKDVSEVVEGQLVKKDALGTFWNSVAATKNVNKEGQVEFSNGKKPEELISKIIEMSTDEHDIVLDFFMGSGTTAATALKMNRRFIGIEQMDYINDFTVPRLQNVIAGEQAGISQAVDWHGGGSFIYAELMEKNQGYIKEILAVKEMKDLKIVYERMVENADLDFRVDLAKIDWSIGLEGMRKILLAILDKNQLYYNFSEIDDSTVRELINDSDYKFNNQFYKEE